MDLLHADGAPASPAPRAGGLRGTADTLRGRWRAWWEGRHPRSDTLTLTQRNVYIPVSYTHLTLPTTERV